jgi:hypothetical protein
MRVEGWITRYASSYCILASLVQLVGLAHSVSDFANNGENSEFGGKQYVNSRTASVGGGGGREVFWTCERKRKDNESRMDKTKNERYDK